jgi:hypothetical protein
LAVQGQFPEAMQRMGVKDIEFREASDGGGAATGLVVPWNRATPGDAGR